jgi:hypothetical protein
MGCQDRVPCTKDNAELRLTGTVLGPSSSVLFSVRLSLALEIILRVTILRHWDFAVAKPQMPLSIKPLYSPPGPTGGLPIQEAE